MDRKILYRFLRSKINDYVIPSFEVKVKDWYNIIIPAGMSNAFELEKKIKEDENFLVNKERHFIDLTSMYNEKRGDLNLTEHKLKVLAEGIEAAKKILIFDTIGLDPKGVDIIYSEINKFISKLAIIELFYPTNVDTKVLPHVKVLDIGGDLFKQGVIQQSKHIRFKF